MKLPARISHHLRRETAEMPADARQASVEPAGVLEQYGEGSSRSLTQQLQTDTPLQQNGDEKCGLTNHVLRDHAALGGIAALLLVPCFGLQGSVFFWLANILIDVDHYLHFVIASRGKSLGAHAMFQYHQGLFKQVHRPDFLAIEIFHTLEFLAVLGWLSFGIWSWLRPVFWGSLFHMIVDFVHLSRHGALLKRANSFVEYAIRREWLKQRGLTPDWVMTERPEPVSRCKQ